MNIPAVVCITRLFFLFSLSYSWGGKESVFPEIHMGRKTVKTVASKFNPPAGSCSPPTNLWNKTSLFHPAIPTKNIRLHIIACKESVI